MSAGHPLTDEDRWPWLQAIADEIDRVCEAGERAVIACSALKRAYRDILVHGRNDVRIVYLDGTQQLIADRLAARKGHFMPPGLAGQPVQDAGAAGPQTKIPSPSRSTLRSMPSSMTSSANSGCIPPTPARRAGTAHDPHRPRCLRCRRHAGDQGQGPDRRRQGRGAAAEGCRHRLHHRLQPSDDRHALPDRTAGDHAAVRLLQRQLDRRSRS